MQMNDQNKLTIKTKERAKQLNELTNELVAASLFDSNLFFFIFLNISEIKKFGFLLITFNRLKVQKSCCPSLVENLKAI